MTASLANLLAVLAGYLVGAVPFAYLIVLQRKGIDIRTVGSGNVGATNAARLLGFRYFWLIFGLDVAKGFLPTWLLPRLADSLAAADLPGLPVLVGLAAILGHNFPVFLGFRGGKGVATSFGVFLALDPAACVGAAATFVAVLLLTRYVSLSSVAGALGFTAIHFTLEPDPWGRYQLLMSVATLAMLGLLIVRHRKNYARIWAGTEPKVALRRHPTGPASK